MIGQEANPMKKRPVEIIGPISLTKNVKKKKKKKTHLTEFAFLPSAFMKTLTSSFGACTYVFNLTQK